MRNYKFYLTMFAVLLMVSFTSKAESVVDVIVNSPNHTILETALIEANLVDDLEGSGSFTVFAPTDDAFNALPEGVLEALLADSRGALTQVLLYHLVKGQVMSTDLSDGMIVETYNDNDKKIKVTINGAGVFINNAKVTVADIVADNGVVHVIDAVLIPSADVNITETESMGKVITDAYGRTLYLFSKDAKGASLCTGGCLNNWPVFYTESMEVGENLNAGDFASIDRGDGVMQTTYKGWPLYYFINDTIPGSMKGEGVIGKWFVAKPDYTIMITDNQLTGLNGVNYKGDYTTGDEVIQYFTDDKGLTLYTWKNDRYNVNKFTKSDFSNNGVWPIYEESEIIIPSVLNESDFSVINVHGRNQLTFKGWPLYYFGQDMLVRGNNKGVSVPSPGVWPVPVKDMMMASIPETVVDIIVNSPDHTTLEAAVIAAGLVETLQGEGPFTVFAPTDAAFAALPEGTLEDLLADPTGDLTDILLYHVVAAKAMSSDLSDGQVITTVFGQDVTVTISEEGVFINDAQVTVADLEAVNGVVHIIDAVLTPLPATVVDIIVNSPDHTTLEAAVIAAGLVETLQGEGPFTVFAPTDAAFAALPEGTLEDLLADPTGDLTDILLYHVVAAKAMSADLSDGQVITTVFGQDVTVTVSEEGVFINEAQVTVADLEAVNGVVHVIDAVLTPLPATVVDIIVNSPDHTTLEAAVVAAGLVETLQGEGPFTVFAPTDAAFAALPEGTIEALLGDIPALTNILLYHVVGAKAMSSDLSDGQKIITFQGQEVTVTINDSGVFIDNAKVTVADLEAVNGVVHVIDAVLIPADKAAFPIDFETKTDADWTVFSNGAGAEDDFMVIPNPDKTGNNTSDNVLKFKVNDGADPWVGAFSNSYAPVEFTADSNKVTMMVWKSVISPVGFKVEASTNGGPVKEVKLSNTVTNQWEKLTFDMSDLIGYSYDRIVIFPDFPNTRTSGTTVYVDNIQIEKKTTVVDIIVNSADHDTLEAAVVAAGLVETLQGDGPFTVFAPTDAAFAALPEGTIEALLGDIPALTDILLYHVVGAKAMSSDLSNGQKIITVEGKSVTVTINDEGVFVNNAKVTVADLEADNGVVHVIDAVLLPPVLPATVVDIIVDSPDHNTLEAAVVAAGLADDLSGTGPFTVFAPTDAAFAALPEGTLDALLADIPTLTDILLYHVVGAKAMSSDLSNGQKIVTLQGKEVTVIINDEGVFINNAKVTVADLEAENGVVHVIDAVLLPPSMPATVVDIIVESPDHNTLEAAVVAAGLVETLQGEGPFTVFAPTDAAFAALPEGTIEALLGDIPALTNILLYHVVGAKSMSSDLSDGQKIITIQGQEVTVNINDSGVFINNAKVTVADLEAENGVVHVIDAVLIPAEKAAFPIDFETKTDAVWNVFANGAGAADDLIIIANPDKSGINTSDNVLKFKVNDGADPWAGAFSNSYAPVEFTADSHTVTMMVWKSVISPVGFKVEASTNGGPVTEVKVSNTVTNQWEKLTFDMSALVGYSYDRIVIFPDFPNTRTSGTTVYIDNIEKEIQLPATVVDIIVNSPDHTTLEAAVVAAGLVDDLQGDGPFTVFAPTDAAFAALPDGTLEALLADIPALTNILLYHVVGAKAMSSDLNDGQKIVTVQGNEVTVTINADGVFIDNAKVTVADLEAENGVVHVIDAVLIPADKAAFPIDFETKTDAVWNVFANGEGAADDLIIIANPDKSGINTSDNVGKFKVNDGADPWAGAFSDSYAPVEFTADSHTVTMMVWKSVISPVGFKVESSTNGGPVTEVKVSNTVTNQWEKLTFDMSALVGYSYDRIVIFPDFPNTRTSGTTVYIDNIEKEIQLPATVVDIIVNSPDHTTLEAAVVAAGLVETLQGDGPFTVFAPTDAAFAALPEGTLEDLLADPTGDLTDILLYHVVAAKAMSSDLSDGQEITTVLGKDVTVTINAEGVFINNAKVTVADLEAENGVVHVIDAVLIPVTTSISNLNGVTVDIYPNPASDHIRINSNEVIEKLMIRDIAGRIVTQMNNISTSERIDISGFKSGMYVVTMQNGNSVISRKLVKR